MKNLTLAEAAELLLSGEVVAIPTETVYGLAADATSSVAVSKIFKTKGRPADNPLIVHISNIAQVDALACDISASARLLMETFWPGPLTIILKTNGVVSKLVTADLATVGLRIPNHKLTLALLQAIKIPLAAPSANLSGKPSPTSAAHVKHDLKQLIPGVVDGGVCQVGLESTVIDMTAKIPTILRPGGICKQQIEAVIGQVAVADATAAKPRAPGMKYTHYSPDARVYLVKGSVEHFRKTVASFQAKNLKVGVMHSENTSEHDVGADVVKTVDQQGQRLYAAMREFDADGVAVILCEFFTDDVVMNRLLKASEERILSEMEN